MVQTLVFDSFHLPSIHTQLSGRYRDPCPTSDICSVALRVVPFWVTGPIT